MSQTQQLNSYAIFVQFDVKAEKANEFKELVTENAKISNQESGCQRFDVLVAADNPHCFLLYEAYENEDAFKHHIQSAHFRKLDEITSGFVTKKIIAHSDAGDR